MNVRAPEETFSTALHTQKDRHTCTERAFPASTVEHDVLIEAREEFLSDKQVKSALCGALFSSYLT
ncbi:hypothetical protein J7443_23260 [Tropicibacter sp. R15_0]|uniref:hypothetical protein n=1 Tax=Tropicibacter sp. R15_0 TaxID=2821101 RepID=UPI001ADBF97B|nr:hypothetical protein [Tropicibacter sp. R15_0]MBO9468164.1 hypothetical protein [Tropicibacter sp. R15_0]